MSLPTTSDCELGLPGTESTNHDGKRIYEPIRKSLRIQRIKQEVKSLMSYLPCQDRNMKQTGQKQ